jgi:hypothetical protein
MLNNKQGYIDKFEKIIEKFEEYCGVFSIFFIVLSFIITLNFSGEWGGLLPNLENIKYDLKLTVILIFSIILSAFCLINYLKTHNRTHLVVYYLTIIIYIIFFFIVLSPIINFLI